MISTEMLRRYPFFSFLSAEQLREIAMITDEVEVSADAVLFETGAKAEVLYLLVSGLVELHYVVVDEHEPDLRKDFLVGVVNPGEILGVSAVIEPYSLTATAVVVEDSRLLKISAESLRDLLERDERLALMFLKQVNKATMARLQTTRIQLAAATAA
jgi:CRP-like cAMP-binding protein